MDKPENMPNESEGDAGWRTALVDYILEQAKPVDKFSHQARLYGLATQLAKSYVCDDEILFAAAWLHDVGVFIGHRPELPEKLATWDHLAYAVSVVPEILRRIGFPHAKVNAVLEAIRTHLPSTEPTSIEGVILRDADILEQLGAVGILRTVSKVGRDTRFVRFDDALKVLRRNCDTLPGILKLEQSRQLARPRVDLLQTFLVAAQAEADGTKW
jgi:uncharacterized protein